MRCPARHIVRAVAATCAALLPAFALFAAQPGDRPLKVIQTTEVRLNNTLDTSVPSQGEVRVLLLVDDHGELKDMLLLGSTHRAFTQAAVAALQEWEFEPARSRGQPVWTRNSMRIFFDSRGRIVSVTGGEMLSSLVGGPFAQAFNNRLAPQSELDMPLQASVTVRPKYPAQLSQQLGERAVVLLDFYVDEDGRPRMPVAERSAHPVLTEAAMNALDQWRFHPPTRRGMPVVVRAKQEFVFLEGRLDEARLPAASDPTS
jgi:TonB family protein